MKMIEEYNGIKEGYNGVKEDSSNLNTKDSNNLKLEIAEAISTGKVSTADDIVSLFGLTLFQAVNLLNDPTFLITISKYSQAKANLTFHSKGLNKLSQIVDSEDNKEAMQAIKLLANYSNNLKQGNSVDVSVNLNLESMVKESEKNINPIIDIEKEFNISELSKIVEEKKKENEFILDISEFSEED